MKVNSVVPAVALALTIPNLSAQTATWTDGAAGQLLYTTDSYSHYASNNHKWNQSQSTVVDPGNLEGTYPSDVSNWDTPSYPNSTGVSVVIDAHSPVELGIGVSIANLNVGAAGQLNINRAGLLNVHGGIITNSGSILISDEGVYSGDATMRIHGPVSLEGSGQIVFTGTEDNVIDSANPADVLTIGANQELTTSSDSSSIWSNIKTAAVNNGTVTAATGGLKLSTNDKTNNSLIQTTGGGTLRCDGITLDNVGGTITLDPAGTLLADGCTLSGGLIDGSGTVSVLSTDATFTSGLTIDSGISVQVGRIDILTLADTITNNGSIIISDEGVYSGEATMRIDGHVLLEGSGQVVLTGADDNVIDSANPADVLTIGANQELTTSSDSSSIWSNIKTAAVNNGTITAATGGLKLSTNDKTNNSLIQTTGGGTLRCDEITLENAGGTITLDPAGTLLADGCTLSGGLIDGSGTVSVLSTDATFTSGLIIDSGISVQVGRTDILTLTDTITNNGSIIISDEGVYSGEATMRIDGPVLLEGSGQVVLTGTDDNVIDSANPADVLIIGANQELTTSSDSSSIWSNIKTAAVNNGTVTAATGGLNLSTNDKTNHGLIQTTGGGTLRCKSITIDNSGGIISLDPAGTLLMDAGTISGGLLDGSGMVNVLGSGSTFTNGLTIGSGISVQVGRTEILTLSDTITNDGSIIISDEGVYTGEATMRIDGPVSLEGSGQVVLTGADDNVIDSADPAHVLTIGPDQEIITSIDSSPRWSAIQTATVNNGTITAATGGLKLSTNDKTNNSLIQTTGGGTLRCTAITIDNTAGTISLDAGGTLLMDGCTISGGLLDGSGTVDVQTSDGTFSNGLTISPGVSVRMKAYEVLTLSDTITNNGDILIDDTGSGVATLRISGPVTVNGSGRIVFEGYDDNVFDSVNPGDVLTLGAAQTITTSEISKVEWSILHVATVNNGVIEGNDGALSLRTNPKTNNGTFRATNGGELEVRTADTILTNYNATTGTLTGGRWEVSSTDAVSVMDLQGATITNLAPGTEVVLTGALSSFPALMLDTVGGTLAINELQVLELGETDLTVNGTLQFGLTDGATDGWDATRIDLDGNVNLTGSTVDITGTDITPGVYELIHWTGTLTGIPTLGSTPEGFSYSLAADANSLNLTVSPSGPATPVILDIAYDPATNTATITYQSINGVIFGVLGSDGSVLPPPRIFAPTEAGDGSIKTHEVQPPLGKDDEGRMRYFFQLVNPAPDPS